MERHGTDALLRSVAVHHDWRSHAIERRLSDDRIKWAAVNAITTIYLLTDSAAPYWQRLGFERIARDSAPPAIAASSEWQSGCPASAVAMRLAIRQ